MHCAHTGSWMWIDNLKHFTMFFAKKQFKLIQVYIEEVSSHVPKGFLGKNFGYVINIIESLGSVIFLLHFCENYECKICTKQLAKSDIILILTEC